MAITNFLNFTTNISPLTGDYIVGFVDDPSGRGQYEHKTTLKTIFDSFTTYSSNLSGITPEQLSTGHPSWNVFGDFSVPGRFDASSINSQGVSNSVTVFDRNGLGTSASFYKTGDKTYLTDSVRGTVITYTSAGNVGIGTTAPTETLHVDGSVLSTSLTATSTAAQTLTSGAIVANGTTGAFVLDDSGHKRISWNDGGGNLNIRGGHYFNGTNLVYAKSHADSNGGAASITLGSDVADGIITLNVAPIATPGTVLTSFANTVTIDKNGTTTTKPVNAPNTAKAWVNFNGVGAGSKPIGASYNIQSVVRSSTQAGQYTITYINPVGTNNCVIATARDDSGGYAATVQSQTSTGCVVHTWRASPLGTVDNSNVNIVVFGF